MPFIKLDNLKRFLNNIKTNFATKDEVNAKQDKGSYVTYSSSSNITVGKFTGTTYKYGQSPMVVEKGLVVGGTAANAGLVTRGICGVSPPDETTGACSTDHLYINYDSGSNAYGRVVVLGAGSVGNVITTSTGATTTASAKYGNTYTAVRGDQMVNYVTDKINALTATEAQINALFE